MLGEEMVARLGKYSWYRSFLGKRAITAGDRFALMPFLRPFERLLAAAQAAH